MKIKSDFVTNSSSTSFILHGVVHGRMSRLKNLKKIATSLGGEIKNAYSDSISFEMPVPDPEGNEDGEVSVGISNGFHYLNLEDDEDKECSFVDIDVVAPITCRKQGRDSIIKETISKILKEIINSLPNKERPKCQGVFSYLQFPTEEGDGWNGGDPGGDYWFLPDMFLKETVSGELAIDGENLYIKWNGSHPFSEEFGGDNESRNRKSKR